MEPELPTVEDTLYQLNIQAQEDYQQYLIAYQQDVDSNPRPSLPVPITSLDTDQCKTLKL